jgi:UDP-N-acetyl-D-galactosamine dehydrogenase
MYVNGSVAVIGLGYVGLPLAVAFGKHRHTIGYDLSHDKVKRYQSGFDDSGTVSSKALSEAKQLSFTTDATLLANADFVIIAVPTPIDGARKPDLAPLIQASHTVGQYLKAGSVVIYESTVYPGATEEVCIPILEKTSGLKWKQDFYVGYSPERINPGDKNHTLTNTIKVVSGDTPETLIKITTLYQTIVEAGVHPVSSIKVAEAAKVIENTQRDLNIALMNELAIIFNMLGLDTTEVLEAAGTKWNFLPFRPGLVGGHCIGVDPYYLTYKAEMHGYHPDVILAGRRINDSMGKYIAEQTIKQLIKSGHAIKGAKVNILGITFKENVPDVRNSTVADLIKELHTYGVDVFVHDPLANSQATEHEYNITLRSWENLPVAEALIVAVAHDLFMAMPLDNYVKKLVPNGCFIDIKSKFNINDLCDKNINFWRL